jgi:hypothetical protein
MKLSNEKLLHSELSWNINTTFILAVHDFDVSNSGVKPDIFTEDSAEMNYFKIMLPVHIMDVLVAETIT